jgi:hypothetical protein
MWSSLKNAALIVATLILFLKNIYLACRELTYVILVLHCTLWLQLSFDQVWPHLCSGGSVKQWELIHDAGFKLEVGMDVAVSRISLDSCKP